MRERHEPARRADDEDPPLGTAASTRRFARLVPSPATRRDALGRLGLTVLACTVVLSLVLVAIVSGGRALVRWLHERPAYQLRFDEMTLEPEPPAWFVRGRVGFLDGLRSNAKRPESLSVLDVDLAKLRDDFRHYAWVKKVKGVEKLVSNRIVVRLDYREPVARWEKDPKVVIDGDGVILPGEDINTEAAERLMWLASVDHPPFDSRPGEPWKKGNAAEGLTWPDERVMAAARLAGFLKARRVDEILPALRVVAIHPTPDSRLFVQFTDDVMAFWDEPPGDERPGRPTASEKWTLLRDRARRQGSLGIRYPKGSLAFSKDGIDDRLATDSPRP